MPLSSNEAAEMLRDIDRTTRRSANAYGYSAASPHLILWGVIWIVGYGATALQPHSPALQAVWPGLCLVGAGGSFWIGWRMRPASAAGHDWRYVATFAAIVLFVFALFSIMPPTNGVQMGAFFPLLASLFYALIGIWAKGARMILLGMAIAALTLFGFFALRSQFALWMAAVGGGGLILGGLWLRSV